MTVAESVGAAPKEADRRPPRIGLVSVIVPHLDDYDNLDACLTLLGEQSFPDDRREVIVADNGSSRGLDVATASSGLASYNFGGVFGVLIWTVLVTTLGSRGPLLWGSLACAASAP